jgi:GWxTD domain-containing protein
MTRGRSPTRPHAPRSLAVCDRRLRYALLTAVLLLAPSLAAQGPDGATGLSPAAVADSQRVLTTLDRTVRRTPHDAAAWHHLGQVSWVLATRGGATPLIRGLVPAPLRARADDALRRAVQLAPDSVAYRLTLSAFLTDQVSRAPTRQAERYAEEILRLLPDTSDGRLEVETALYIGRSLWHSYETMAHRRITREPGADTLRSVLQLLGRMAGFNFDAGIVPMPSDFSHAITQLLINTTEQPFEVSGEAAYLRAERWLRQAYDRAPVDAQTYRALATLYAGRDRWAELSRLARDHTLREPADPWGWMGLGLALARLRDIAGAREALTTGLDAMLPADRQALDRIERISTAPQIAQLAALDAVTRERAIAAQWFVADPLWSTDDEDPRVEFLARIAYAELRWGAPESGRRGVDTDRGRVFLRYGPPDVIARLTYDPRGSTLGSLVGARDEIIDAIGSRRLTVGTDQDTPGLTSITLYWVYDAGLVFAFTNLRTLAFDDQAINDYVFESQPARFDNIAMMQIDSMPAQVVRFRAGADSVELFVASRAPVASMRALAARGTALQATTWLYGRTVPDAFRERTPVTADGVLYWTQRVRAGDYLWRVETTAEGLLAAGRASSPLTLRDDEATGFAIRGTGLSDILLGTAMADDGGAARWQDARVTPLIGALSGQRTIALLWESYELASEAGTARFEVQVQLRRVRGSADRIVARVIGALAAVAGVDRNADGVAIRYSRATAVAPVIVEQLTLDLGDTPPGEYTVRVEVRDSVSGRVFSRATRLLVE